ncbi:hypothetical protein QQ045_031497 [Rhodiola kirilowii]
MSMSITVLFLSSICTAAPPALCPLLLPLLPAPIALHLLLSSTIGIPPLPMVIRHLDEKPQLVIIKRAGHAVNVHKPKQIYKHIKEFLVDPKQESKNDGNKIDDGKKSE